MSAISPTLRDEITESNRAIEHYLRGHYGMTLKLFKTSKAMVQLAGVITAFYAMYLGAPPFLTFAGAVGFVLGPESLEMWLAQAGATEPQNVSELDRAIEDSDITAQDIVDELEGE